MKFRSSVWKTEVLTITQRPRPNRPLNHPQSEVKKYVSSFGSIRSETVIWGGSRPCSCGRRADFCCKSELNGELEESGRSGLRPSFLRCAYTAKVSNEPILQYAAQCMNGCYQKLSTKSAPAVSIWHRSQPTNLVVFSPPPLHNEKVY